MLEGKAEELITLRYHPDFARPPAPLQARVHEILRQVGADTDRAAEDGLHAGRWPEEARRKVETLLPIAISPAAPQLRNRAPADLR